MQLFFNIVTQIFIQNEWVITVSIPLHVFIF